MSKRRSSSCCVLGCTSKYKDDVHFYRFPTSTVVWRNWRRQKWIKAVIKHNKEENWQPGKYTKICSAHFAGGKKSEHPLHPAFNPSIFPGNSSKNGERLIARFERQLKREQLKPSPVKPLNKEAAPVMSTSSKSQIIVKPIVIEKTVTIIPSITEKSQYVDNESEFFNEEKMEIDGYNSVAKIVASEDENKFKDFQCQVCLLNEKNSTKSITNYIMCNMKVENNLNCAETYIDLQKLENNKHEKIKTTSCDSIFNTPWLKPIEFNGISSIQYNNDLEEISGVTFVTFNKILKILPEMNQLAISNANRLLIFLMKLKQGLSTFVLSILFHLPPATINRIIRETLEYLAILLKSHVYWPEKKEDMKTVLPEVFKNKYRNFRAIIDCIELQVEVPTNTKERKEIYTNYKNGCSFKLVLAFAPNGFITYKSKCYGGQKNYELVTNDCGFIDLINANDLILAIKEFPSIKAVIQNKDAFFVTPSFLEKPEECNILIHILHSVDQIKQFKILSSIPIDLISKIEDIVQVCCSLNNLRLPLKKT